MIRPIHPLSEYLGELNDPRKAKGLRHPLVAILCLCVVAMMSGAKTPKSIANWIKHRPELLVRLGSTNPMVLANPLSTESYPSSRRRHSSPV
jgi:hypothetical protein